MVGYEESPTVGGINKVNYGVFFTQRMGKAANFNHSVPTYEVVETYLTDAFKGLLVVSSAAK
jgi:hypothetical protein